MKNKVKALLKSKKGDIANLNSVFVMMGLMVFLSCFLWVTSVFIQCMDMRTTVQQSMNDVISDVSANTHTAMREDRLVEYTEQLTDVSSTESARMRFRVFKTIMQAEGAGNGDVSLSNLGMDMNFEVSDEGDQIIFTYTYVLEVRYPPLIKTERTFSIPVEETVTINTVFM